MERHLAAERRALGRISGRGSGGPGVLARLRAAVGPRVNAIPLRWRLVGTALAGMLAAASVGYLGSQNPQAAPPQLAVVLRVAIITSMVGAGIYAQTSKVQARMGPVLVVVGLYASLWLLNGSANPAVFTVGLLFSGSAPALVYYLILAHPDGRLHSPLERRVLAWAGGALGVLWVILLLISRQPPHTPLLRCAPHCPTNGVFIGSAGALHSVLSVAIWVGWTTLACAAPLLLTLRVRLISQRLRRVVLPMEVVAAAGAVAWLGFLTARGSDPALGGLFGTLYASLAAAVPIAILIGLFLERRSIGQGLAAFVNQLALRPAADPEQLMRSALNDQSLRIAYYARGFGAYVDASGAPVELPRDDPARAITPVQNVKSPVAAVIYDATLADQATFLQAAAAAVIMRLQREQLEADLKASTRALAASRQRLVDASNAERQRIERDLHDGVQQHLVALRLKLAMATEVVLEEPPRGQRMLDAVGRQMDELLAILRSMARGIYPSLLTDHGLADALTSEARRAPLPVSIKTRGLTRYPEEVEVAVYFCCLEALQNAVKHAGNQAKVSIRLWGEPGSLWFQVHDTGVGFDQQAVDRKHGLLNMRDRIEAVGGTLTITSRRALGTTVRGSVSDTPRTGMGVE